MTPNQLKPVSKCIHALLVAKNFKSFLSLYSDDDEIKFYSNDNEIEFHSDYQEDKANGNTKFLIHFRENYQNLIVTLKGNVFNGEVDVSFYFHDN